MAAVDPMPIASASAASTATAFALFHDRHACRINDGMPRSYKIGYASTRGARRNARGPAAQPKFLLVAQRHHRIDARGAAGREVAGSEPRNGDDSHHTGECGGIVG